MDELDYSDIKILLVDDDESYLTITKGFLVRKGICVESECNPEKALEILKETHFDIVLVDFFMPQMTGAEFIGRLRSFNKEIVIVLQTGYADEKPPIQMLSELNIQGYHDKSNGVEDLLLLTLSAIRTAHLVQLVKKQEKQIDMLNYKNEFIGKLLVGLTNEMKNQTLVISAQKEIIESEINGQNDGQMIQDSCKVIENQLAKQNELLYALNFEMQDNVLISNIIKTLKILTNIELKKANTILEINQCADILLKCKLKSITFVLVEVVLYLSNLGENQIRMDTVKTGEEVDIIFLKENTYTEDFMEKLKQLSENDENISISIQNNTMQIHVK